jgi:hypothetical protein
MSAKLLLLVRGATLRPDAGRVRYRGGAEARGLLTGVRFVAIVPARRLEDRERCDSACQQINAVAVSESVAATPSGLSQSPMSSASEGSPIERETT